jgi:hypothetical protein
MPYDNDQGVRLEGADLEKARGMVKSASEQLEALGQLVASTIGRAEDMEPGRRIVGVETRLPSGVPVVTTFCDYTTGECIGVWDDAAGICRPCGPDDTGCTPHPHLKEPETLPE